MRILPTTLSGGFALAAALLLVSAAQAPAPQPSKITIPKGPIAAEELRDLVETLASPDFEGRGSGQAGGKKAGDFIADQMKERGVEPFGVDGTYFQPFTDGVSMRNVVGIVKAAAGGKPDEYLILGAHYDHCGLGLRDAGAMGNQGEVHYGADDNASGTSGVLAVARAIAQAPLARSVIFILFDGEERGLLGSKHYADNPLVPLAKTHAMINIDMIGRSTDGYLFVAGIGTSPVWDPILTKNLKAEAKILKNVERSKDDEARSDQHNFVMREVPAIFFFAGMHKDYHQPRDTPDKIQYKPAAAIGRVVLETLKGLAAAKEKPLFQKVGGNGMPKGEDALEADVFRRATAMARRLGGKIGPTAAGVPQFLDTEGRGSKAGIERGDQILAIRRRGSKPGPWVEVKSVESLRLEVEKMAAGDSVQLKILRAGKESVIDTEIGPIPEWKKGPATDKSDLPPGPISKGKG